MIKIKFRLWEKELKAMITAENSDQFLISLDGRVFDTGFTSSHQAEYCEDMVAMQFTGLKDKNGVDIYEGDILKGLADFFSVSISGYFSSGSVGFGVNYSRCGDCSEFSIEGNPFGQEKDFEVVGNIHETPELLE